MVRVFVELEVGRAATRGEGAVWRILASLFWPKGTLKRPRCDTVLAQKRRPFRGDAEKAR
jgi:hypothetical protein